MRRCSWPARAPADVVAGNAEDPLYPTFFVNPSVKSAADLKGGVIAMSTFGSESDATVTLALKKLGMSGANASPTGRSHQTN